MTKLHLPSPVRFSLGDGRVFQIAPHTRRQMRAALELEPATDAMLPRLQAGERAARQLSALVGREIMEETADGIAQCVPAAPLLLELCPAQEVRLLSALLANGTENEPAGCAQARRSRESADVRMRSYDADTVALAVHLGIAPGAVEKSVGFVESLMLLDGLWKERERTAKWEAALHDKQLR